MYEHSSKAECGLAHSCKAERGLYTHRTCTNRAVTLYLLYTLILRTMGNRTYGKARADALLPSTAKGRHALSSMALGDLSFRVSSSLTPSRVIPMDPSHK
jgi:hypothetical protein